MTTDRLFFSVEREKEKEGREEGRNVIQAWKIFTNVFAIFLLISELTLGINKVVFHVFFIHPNVWGIIKAKPISQLYTGCVIAQSCLTLCHPWTVAHQVTLSMGFSRQEYWRRLLFLSPGDLPDLGIEPSSPALADVFFTTVPPISQMK